MPISKWINGFGAGRCPAVMMLPVQAIETVQTVQMIETEPMRKAFWQQLRL